MKRLFVSLVLGLGYYLFAACPAFSQTPDPRDSVIIESKTVYPGDGPAAAYVKVYITNKDTLGGYTLCLVERSLSGGAYMTLGYPRTFEGVVRPLTTSLQSYNWFASRDSLWWGYVHNQYNSVSPDTLFIAGIFDGTQVTIEPPNMTRKALLEIKFDTVKAAFGNLELDTTSRYIHSQKTLFASRRGIEMPVNFKKGIITVANSGSCEDMNGDGDLTMVDIVQALNCVTLKENDCSRTWTISDVTVLLKRLFYDGSIQPLIPPAPCD